MLKILLITLYKDARSSAMEEIGIESIAAFLRSRGYDVMLSGQTQDQLDYSKIVEFNPGIVGVPVYNTIRDLFYRFSSKIKQMLPGVLICAGGYYPTYNDRELLEEAPMVDFVVRGEGEITFLQLVEAIEQNRSLENIPGLTYRSEGETRSNPDRDLIDDLDTLPVPARDILEKNNLKIALLSTSRGCKAACTFCVNRTFWKKWRGRSVSLIMDEIRTLHAQGHRQLNIIDSSFEDPDLNRMMEIARGISQLDPGISYFIDVRAEFYHKASDQDMKLLKKSGLRGVLIGIEAGNPTDHKLYAKMADLQDSGKTISFFRSHGIAVTIGFINFNPYSTFETLRENIDFLEKHGFASCFDCISNRLMVFKGSTLYRVLEKDGLLQNTISQDPRAYLYKDERIRSLALYISDYMDRLGNMPRNIVDGFYFYTNYFNVLLQHYKHHFDTPALQQGLEQTLHCENRIAEILGRLNNLNAQWSRELLNLAEKGWNKLQANIISNRVISPTTLHEILTELDMEQFTLSEKLLRLGPQYTAHLTWK